MLSHISNRPTFRFGDLLTREKNVKKVFPLDQIRCYYFFSARYALGAGVKALGIGPNETVLVPAYNCGVEVDAIIKQNIKPIFYKIRKNLQVDLDDLKDRIDRSTKAVLLTHFFGFPQQINEMKEICQKKNLFLIEDCAHAFLSKYKGVDLGSIGDVGIFSLRKSLPIPEGGVLVVNNEKMAYDYEPERGSSFSAYFVLAEMLKNRTLENGNIESALGKLVGMSLFVWMTLVRLLLRIYKKTFRQKGLYLIHPEAFGHYDDISRWGISNISKKIVNNTSFDEVFHTRRNNFNYLLNYFLRRKKGILLFEELPPGVCPLIFPIITESSKTRDMLIRNLEKKGIASQPWWDRFHAKVPWEEFPDSAYLKETVLGLPIHQDLTFRHLDRVIESFEDAYRRIQR